MHRIPLPIRFGPHHRRALHGVFLGVWLSGALWLLFHYFFATPGEFGPAPHVSEKWWLRLHGLFAFAALITVGSVLPVHARSAWQKNKNRATGAVMKTWLLWLAVTGYALYYFLGDANAAWLPPLHWLPGLALPALLAFHIRRGRARHARRPVSASASAEAPIVKPASSAPFCVASPPSHKHHAERKHHAPPDPQTRAAGDPGRTGIQRPGRRARPR